MDGPTYHRTGPLLDKGSVLDKGADRAQVSTIRAEVGRQLLEGVEWICKIHPKNSKPYFYAVSSKQPQWTPPTGWQVEGDATPGQAAAGRDGLPRNDVRTQAALNHQLSNPLNGEPKSEVHTTELAFVGESRWRADVLVCVHRLMQIEAIGKNPPARVLQRV